MKKLLFSFAILLLGCGSNEGDNIVRLDKVSIKIGEAGEEFLNRNSLSETSNVQRQPAGLNFYRYRWPSSERGNIELVNEGHSFVISDALSLQGVEDEENLSNGVFAYSINFGFAGGGQVSHNQVRKEFLDFIDHLISLGWSRVISYHGPRLSGKEAYHFYKNNSRYSFPLDYRPTLEEWIDLDDAQWRLKANDVFIDIDFHRDPKKMNPDEPGSYLFVMNIQSAEQFAKGQFEPEDRENWQELWEDEIRRLKRHRYKQEELIKKAGGTIDTSYRDPIIHPNDPVEME